MDVNEVLFVFLGNKWTLGLIGTVLLGGLTGGATLYKLVERWSTREQRRLDMLHEYLDKEEKDITSRRRPILQGIRAADQSFLGDKKFDVGAEIDEAIGLLDQGLPDRAAGRLIELEKKIEENRSILERRVQDLRRHKASVQIFLAALADANGDSDGGLGYVNRALDNDTYDLDALKYQGILFLRRASQSVETLGAPNPADLDSAEQSFNKLRINSTDNPSHRADAYLGLGSVEILRGVIAYDHAYSSLTNAVRNINSLPPDERDLLSLAHTHEQLGLIFSDSCWGRHDNDAALDQFLRARAALNQIPHLRGEARRRYHRVFVEIERLEAARRTTTNN